MANRYAVANGNWSNTATWDGGTLPGILDDVRANNFTVTIDQNIDVASIRTDAATPAVAGGRFQVTTSSPIEITADVVAGANLTTGVDGCLHLAGVIDVTVIGNVFGSATRANNDSGIFFGNGNLSIFGNIYGGEASNALGVRMSGGVLSVTGNIYGSNSGLSNTQGIRVENGSIEISGFVYAVSTNGILSTANHSIVGGVYVGNITFLGNFVSAISNLNTTTEIVVDGGIYYQTCAPFGNGIRFKNNNNIYYTVTDSANNAIQLVNSNSTDFPVVGNVRLGTSYAGGALVGTLIVPNPTDVRIGIPTDDTVGTGIITGADFFNLIATSTDPVAERLRNVATVQTVGDQFNSF